MLNGILWRFRTGFPGRRYPVSILNPGAADKQALPSKFARRFKVGDVLRFEMAGAGGYGPVAERDPAAIEEDVRQGKVTRI